MTILGCYPIIYVVAEYWITISEALHKKYLAMILFLCFYTAFPYDILRRDTYKQTHTQTHTNTHKHTLTHPHTHIHTLHIWGRLFQDYIMSSSWKLQFQLRLRTAPFPLWYIHPPKKPEEKYIKFSRLFLSNSKA